MRDKPYEKKRSKNDNRESSNDSIEEVAVKLKKTGYTQGEIKNILGAAKIFLSPKNMEIKTMLEQQTQIFDKKVPEKEWKSMDKKVMEMVVKELNENDSKKTKFVIIDIDIFSCFSSDSYDKNLEMYIGKMSEMIMSNVKFEEPPTILIMSFPGNSMEDIHLRDKNLFQLIEGVKEYLRHVGKQINIEYMSHIRSSIVMSVLRRNNLNENTNTYPQYVNNLKARNANKAEIPIFFVYNLENTQKYYFQARCVVEYMETVHFITALAILLNNCDDIFVRQRKVEYNERIFGTTNNTEEDKKGFKPANERSDLRLKYHENKVALLKDKKTQAELELEELKKTTKSKNLTELTNKLKRIENRSHELPENVKQLQKYISTLEIKIKNLQNEILKEDDQDNKILLEIRCKKAQKEMKEEEHKLNLQKEESEKEYEDDKAKRIKIIKEKIEKEKAEIAKDDKKVESVFEKEKIRQLQNINNKCQSNTGLLEDIVKYCQEIEKNQTKMTTEMTTNDSLEKEVQELAWKNGNLTDELNATLEELEKVKKEKMENEKRWEELREDYRRSQEHLIEMRSDITTKEQEVSQLTKKLEANKILDMETFTIGGDDIDEDEEMEEGKNDMDEEMEEGKN